MANVLNNLFNAKIMSNDLMTLRDLRVQTFKERKEGKLTKLPSDFYARTKNLEGQIKEVISRSKGEPKKLEKANAVSEWRNLMGATNPAEAEAGSIRAKYGTDISMNATHGSDSNENAKIEINFFF